MRLIYSLTPECNQNSLNACEEVTGSENYEQATRTRAKQKEGGPTLQSQVDDMPTINKVEV